MKRVQKVGMDGILIDEEKSIKKTPRKYIPGVIEEYIKEDRISALIDPQTSEESKQLIRELYEPAR